MRHPTRDEKQEYRARVPQEAFIVPILRGWIDQALAQQGRSCRANKRVMDVGCGAQPFRKCLEKMGYAYASLDAAQNIAGTVDFVAAIDAELPASILAQGPYDLLLCTEVLEHVADWGRAFDNMSRLLRAGGCLVVTCPHFYVLHEEPFDYWRPTGHAIELFAQRSGLRVSEIAYLGNGWDVLGTLLASCKAVGRGRNPFSHLLAAILNLLRKGLFVVLRCGVIQYFIPLRGPLYLCNVAVLVKT